MATVYLVDRESGFRIRYQENLYAHATGVLLVSAAVPPALGFRVGCIRRHQVVQEFVILACQQTSPKDIGIGDAESFTHTAPPGGADVRYSKSRHDSGFNLLAPGKLK